MKTNNAYQEFIYRHWKHAHEEDQGNHMVFHPASNEFPASRGRVEFILSECGACTFVDIASGDGQENKNCKLNWEADPVSIRIDYPNGRVRTFQIISVDAEKLVINEIY